MTLCLRWDEPLVYQPENNTVKAALLIVILNKRSLRGE
jgi:hypothetical protein